MGSASARNLQATRQIIKNPMKYQENSTRIVVDPRGRCSACHGGRCPNTLQAGAATRAPKAATKSTISAKPQAPASIMAAGTIRLRARATKGATQLDASPYPPRRTDVFDNAVVGMVITKERSFMASLCLQRVAGLESEQRPRRRSCP